MESGNLESRMDNMAIGVLIVMRALPVIIVNGYRNHMIIVRNAEVKWTVNRHDRARALQVLRQTGKAWH